MSAFQPELPAECSANVFSFLELHDCLAFGSVSSSALREILPGLHCRRLHMKQNFASSQSWKGQEPSSAQSKDQVVLMKDKYPLLDWVGIPTVHQRVQQLYHRIPISYPMRDKIRLLKDHLDKLNSDGHDDECLLKDDTVNPTFADIFTAMQQVTAALRLHCEILSSAFFSNPLANGDKGACLLDQYVGDVLCVTYLINDSPNYRRLLQKLRKRAPQSSCYQSFVCMHSNILRNKTFTSIERRRLDIPNFFGVLPEMIPNVCYVNDFFLASEMTLIFHEFGPLGPAFRGRDTVRLRAISARCLFAYLLSNDGLQVPGETSRMALEWLCVLHEEVRNARPMTVGAPILRLSTSRE